MLLLVGMFHVIDRETVCQFYYHHFQVVDKQYLYFQFFYLAIFRM